MRTRTRGRAFWPSSLPTRCAGSSGSASPRQATCWSVRARMSFRPSGGCASPAGTSTTANGTPLARHRVGQWRNRYIRIVAQQRVARAERVIDRPSVGQLRERKPAARRRGRREVRHRKTRLLGAVIGDDRRAVVEITEIESGAAILLHVQIIGGLSHLLADGVALRPRLLDFSGTVRRWLNTLPAMSIAKRDTCSVIGSRSAS